MASFPVLHCQSCSDRRYSSETEWMPNDDRGYCNTCGHLRLLNAERLCKKCYEIETAGEPIECVKCHALFQPEDISGTHCEACKPYCYGCGHKFSPTKKTQIFCTNCQMRLKTKKCTRCRKSSEEVNHHGHCASCQRKFQERGIHWCNVCEVKRVATPDGVCDSCKKRTVKCPYCSNSIASDEFACESCIMKNYAYT